MAKPKMVRKPKFRYQIVSTRNSLPFRCEALLVVLGLCPVAACPRHLWRCPTSLAQEPPHHGSILMAVIYPLCRATIKSWIPRWMCGRWRTVCWICNSYQQRYVVGVLKRSARRLRDTTIRSGSVQASRYSGLVRVWRSPWANPSGISIGSMWACRVPVACLWRCAAFTLNQLWDKHLDN